MYRSEKVNEFRVNSILYEKYKMKGLLLFLRFWLTLKKKFHETIISDYTISKINSFFKFFFDIYTQSCKSCLFGWKYHPREYLMPITGLKNYKSTQCLSHLLPETS